ncbi:MAG: hypothetical protein QM778_17335 [Myxococcales bacterium]
MRILIGNHIDDSLLWQKDQRAFSQRILWFAQDGDIVILSCEPDPSFLEYVTSLAGVGRDTLEFLVVPPGGHGTRLFDPNSLLDPDFVAEVKRRIGDVSDVFALWPSAQVAEFAELLGIREKLPGASFFAQQGDELANNKGNFRAFAAALGVPVAEGAVCRTKEHAERVIARLLRTGPVMVKQVHNGAGNGNEVLVCDDELATDHAGNNRRQRIEPGFFEVRDYLEARWNWASVGGRFAVVVERFVPGARTIYAEFEARDDGLAHTATGSLGYEHGRLVEEVTPLRGVTDAVLARLVHLGGRLAETYRAFGYRGFMSADAVVDQSGNLFFTEMNARVGASLHLYEGIGKRVVDQFRVPERSLIQLVTPKHWKVPGFDAFSRVTRELGVAFDPLTRKGVMAAMPFAGEPCAGGLLFCIAYETEREHHAIVARLTERFG